MRLTAAAVLALAVVLSSTAGCSSSSAHASDRDKTYVVVLDRHVRHEADLAALVSDPIAAGVRARAAAAADQLDRVLVGWRVSAQDASARFATATAAIPQTTGKPVYGCSLHGPIDDVGQVRAALAADAAPTWARLAMTAALEGLQLSATARDQLGPDALRQGQAADALQRTILEQVAPLLPATDQRMARAGGQTL